MLRILKIFVLFGFVLTFQFVDPVKVEAADGTKLEGKVISNTYLVSCEGDELVDAGNENPSSWACYCDAGDLVLAGGVDSGHINRYTTESRPTTDGEGWQGRCRRRTDASSPDSDDCSRVYATCAVVDE